MSQSVKELLPDPKSKLQTRLEPLESATKNTITRPANSNLHGLRRISAFSCFSSQTGQLHKRGHTKFRNIDICIFYIDINIAAHLYRYINIGDINDSSRWSLERMYDGSTAVCCMYNLTAPFLPPPPPPPRAAIDYKLQGCHTMYT